MEEKEKKVIIFIDGDNTCGEYATSIFEQAEKLGKIVESHCFVAHSVNNSWGFEPLYKYCITDHNISTPAETKSSKKKSDLNSADIALVCMAVEILCTRNDIDVFVIVSDDKDYMPLAKTIRMHGKTAVCFHRQETKTIVAFDQHFVLEKTPDESTATPSQKKDATDRKVKSDVKEIPLDVAEKLAEIIESGIENSNGEGYQLKSLIEVCKDRKINLINYSNDKKVNKKRFLEKTLFPSFPKLFGGYIIRGIDGTKPKEYKIVKE